MNLFNQLGLSEEVCKVLGSLGFEQPTAIQQEAIPQLINESERDFIGLAQTGTGKTAAFCLPLLENVLPTNEVQAVILAPTRELVQQTFDQVKQFVKAFPELNAEVIYGGVDIQKQIKALRRNVQIVVSTPGRLQDLIKRKAISLSGIDYVVLDEADEMLNMGFKEEIDAILTHTPDTRNIWLFSATMPQGIRRIVNNYMHQPYEVKVNSKQASNQDISHKYVITKSANKVVALKRFMEVMPEMRAVMFCRTKRETQQFADELNSSGYEVEALHGDLNQNQRNAVMKKFKARGMQLLLATDVAARGIDVNELTHVFHHTLPDQMETYTHRSGRTGRAGNKGTSLVFINSRETRKIKFLEQKLSVSFELIEIPSKAELKSSRINHWAGLLMKTKIDDEAANLIDNLDAELISISKNELLKRLISQQMEQLRYSHELGEEDDLNVRQDARGERDRRSEKDGSGKKKYFINVGQIDGITKADLVHFLADVAEVERKHIGDIDLRKNCSYFYLDAEKSNGFTDKFKDLVVDGHSIRVNLDDSRPKERSRRPERGNFNNKRQNNRKKRDRNKGRRRK